MRAGLSTVVSCHHIGYASTSFDLQATAFSSALSLRFFCADATGRRILVAAVALGRDADAAAAGDDDLDPDLAVLLAAAGEVVEASPFRRKRRRLATAEAAAQGAVGNDEEVRYPSLVTQIRAFYERFSDHERLQPLIRQRKRARAGQFDTERLRLLEDFVLTLNLSQQDQTRLYHLLLFWEQCRSPHAFRQALADDIDRVVIEDGWMSCSITEGGMEVEAFIRTHKLYPVRIRIVNVEADDEEWITIAYVPSVATEKGSGGAEQSKQRRIGILQRVLYLALRDLINASHNGATFAAADGRELLAFPRILMYICDQPEERSVLCLKPGQCSKPCSTCDTPLMSLSAPSALTAMERTILITLHPQLEAATHLLHGRERQRRLHIEKALGVNSYMPALAAMGGLTTAPFLLYKIIGFDVLHVLDLGVTRLLVHRLGQIFPSLCDGHDPLCGSLVATYAESNGRLQFLGRRCRATLAGSDYDMSAKDKQSTFTGREQRQAMPGDEEELGAARTNDGVDKEDMSAAQSNTKFEWAAYRRAFPDTPPHAAITAMFAEYALLVGRITRHLGAAVASPMTLAEGEGIAKQAQEFVLCYAVPILGPLHTTKVHKLLAHLLEAVRLHGNPMNGDNSLNEQKHK
ncbi:hypothetical protein I4F81_001850 [Pyropia yezoensis]|uniref:Uncharacterized protein n=1 Tax=Pyropia yezoensis TaxID=2788 RepID=A0ACC3BMW3_PYRYE|nr:hypothetical protein I4F81_001850 [Neopyropia yezoensis]